MAQDEFSTGWKFLRILFVFRSHGTTFTDVQQLKVPCEQSENIERSRVNEVSGQIFQPVENSSAAVRVNITKWLLAKPHFSLLFPQGRPGSPGPPGPLVSYFCEYYSLILARNFRVNL